MASKTYLEPTVSIRSGTKRRATQRARYVGFFVSLFLPLLAVGAPSINSVNLAGALVQGTTGTISGSSFGNSDPQKNLIWDTVDNQSSYEGLSGGTPIPTDGDIWTHNGNPWSTPLTVERSGDLGALASDAVFRGKKKSYIGWPLSYNDLTNNTLYATWWFKPSGDMGGSADSNKVIRIWDAADGKSTRISWTHHHLIYDAPDIGVTGTASWNSVGTENNKWNRLEIWVDGNTGQIKTWTNGKLGHNISDFRKSTVNEGLTVGLVGFDPSRADNFSNFTFLMDDIYVSPTQARVELSSSSTWDGSSGKREVQPVTNWDNGNINFKLNPGKFDSSNSLYVYVVDSKGNVNQNGYLVSAGTGVAPPNPPVNPTVD